LARRDIARKPEIIQTLRQALHKFALTGHVIEEEQEPELDENDGINALVSIPAIELVHATQRMIRLTTLI
jgi:hypothetical protein